MHKSRIFEGEATGVPSVGIQVEGLPVGIDPEGAEFLGCAVGDGGAPGAAVEPEDEGRGLSGRRRLHEPVEESAAGAGVDGDVAGVLGEVNAGLAGEAGHPVLFLLLRWRARSRRYRC